MASRGIREYHAKEILVRNSALEMDPRRVLIGPGYDGERILRDNPWLDKTRLVAKPDQLFGKRGKHRLVLLDAAWDEVLSWIDEHMGKVVRIGDVTGKLTHFLVEPYVEHDVEYYLAIRSVRDGDLVHFSEKGGVDIEEMWTSVRTKHVPILAEDVDLSDLVPAEVLPFVEEVFRIYTHGFTYLEINPFTLVDGRFYPLDMVARLDDTSMFENREFWGDVEFPPPFGRELTPEEERIRELDERSGASLKLTILNPEGRIWTMVAGGGASVIYADTIVDLGYGDELANYGEYSGNPAEDEVYEYARTILDLMLRGRGEILIIGGGIANFTDVAPTFRGIAKALRERGDELRDRGVKIYVRRGGPNYREGLEVMRRVGEEIGVHMVVCGPETHMTRIVSMALEGD